MLATRIGLDQALDATRTGDLWLFRGKTLADRAIQVSTNSPVNHVGMAVVIDDLPPLMWHAELGRSLEDIWSGTHQRGAQLHDLRSAVTQWSHKYGQKVWFRQLDHPVTREMEEAVLRTIARLDGTPFPSTTRLALRWLWGQTPKIGHAEAEPDDPEMAYCAEIVAITFEEMGLLPGDRRASGFDPGDFWSGDDLGLLDGARLGREIAVDVPPGSGAGRTPAGLSRRRAVPAVLRRRGRGRPPG